MKPQKYFSVYSTWGSTMGSTMGSDSGPTYCSDFKLKTLKNPVKPSGILMSEQKATVRCPFIKVVQVCGAASMTTPEDLKKT